MRTVGYDRVKNLHIAEELRRRIAAVPGIVDAHLQQEVYAPDLYVQIDRARALQFGITPSDITNNIGTSLSSSKQVYPDFWTDAKDGIPHYIAVQTPQYQVSSLGDVGNTLIGRKAERRDGAPDRAGFDGRCTGANRGAASENGRYGRFCGSRARRPVSALRCVSALP